MGKQMQYKTSKANYASEGKLQNKDAHMAVILCQRQSWSMTVESRIWFNAINMTWIQLQTTETALFTCNNDKS